MALPADGQNANDLTKVTEIPAGKELIFFDPTTNEGGIITLENLTKQILNGLTKQTFALDAGQQTILQALNTLNSDSKLIYFVGSEDFGSKIASSGLLSGVRVKFFICNNATNNPIGSGYIILMHAPNFWKNHPNYICVYNSNIKCGTIDCTDITNLKIIQ